LIWPRVLVHHAISKDVSQCQVFHLLLGAHRRWSMAVGVLCHLVIDQIELQPQLRLYLAHPVYILEVVSG
jgi:hypothetical protein